MDADNHQATVMNILVAHESMDDKTAYNIVKADLRPQGRHRRRAQGGAQLQAREPEGVGVADPVPSRRAQVLREKGVKVN
jgi:hypothetical protein